MSVAITQDRTRSRRRSHSRSFVARDSLEQALGYGVEACIAAVIIFSPLVFGAVEYWAQWWMAVGIGLAMLCMLIRWIAYPQTLQTTFTYAFVPIALFLLLAVLQWTPLPTSLVSSLSPKAAAAWSAAAAALPGEAVHRTISLYPLATERQLRILLLVSAVFAIVLTHYRERGQIVRLLSAMVISGACAGLIAISQNASDGPSTWMDVQTTHPDSGPFMNHSAFGQFMNLCIGAAVALLLIGLKHQIGDRVLSFRSLRHHLFRKGSLALVGPFIFVLTAPVLIALSLTRGGVLSMIISAAVASVALGITQSGRGKRTIIAVIAFLVLLVGLKFGFDRTYDRMATLRNVDDTGGGVRLQMVRDMVPMFRDYPVTGVGLGAFSHVFPKYDTAAIPAFATHAENEYAQLAVEAGIVGVLILLSYLVIVAYNAYSAVRFGRRSIHAGSIGLAYGLLAILIHSFSDFGQHVPAIACLTAAISALLIRLGIDARRDRAQLNGVADHAPAPMSSFPARAIVGVVSIVILGTWVWLIARTTVEADAEAAWNSARKNYSEMANRGLLDASDGEFIGVLQSMTKASGLVPGDADYRFGLNVTRWQSDDRYDRALTAGFLQRISDECLKVSTVAPCFGPAMTFAGQVRLFDLGDESGVAMIRHGYELARYSREGSFAVALLDARDGKWDDCLRHLRHAIELGASRSDAANILAERFKRTDLALQLVENSRSDMIRLAGTLERIGETREAQALLDKATAMLISEANQQDAPVDAIVQLAEAYVRAEQPDNAIPLYRRALAVRYDHADWRTALISALVATGQTDEAIREARTNYRLNPGSAEAQQLLEDLVAPRKQRERP